jgi:hypothetical protein
LRLVYYCRLLYCSFCMYSLGGMYFYVIMVYIVLYIDLTVYCVFCDLLSFLCEDYCYNFYYVNDNYLLAVVFYNEYFHFLLFCLFKLLQHYYFYSILHIILLVSYILYSISTVVISSQMATFQKEQWIFGNVIFRRFVENSIYYKNKDTCYDFKEKDSGY